jgi:phosphate/sulfate permease
VRQIIKPYEWDEGNIYRILVFVAASALIAAVIVSGKAFFKKLSITKSHSIVALIARVAMVFMREDGRERKRKSRKEKGKERDAGKGN